MKAGKETAVSVAHRDSRSYNICVSTYKLGFFLSFCDIFVFLKVMLFSVTEMKTFSTQTVPS